MRGLTGVQSRDILKVEFLKFKKEYGSYERKVFGKRLGFCKSV